MTLPAVHAIDPLNVGNAPGDGPLRAGGTPAHLPQADRDLPSTPSLAVKRQLPAVTLMRDLMAGNQRLREARETYLPRAPQEASKDYDARLARSVFVNYTKRTVEGLTGFVFRKDVALGEDVPAVIRTQWENLDNAGTHGDVFVRDLMADAIVAGHAAILVDFPDTGGQTLRLSDEREMGVRPYWVPIKKEQIVSWRTTLEFGRLVLTQLVLKEQATVPDGAFGEKVETRYRVFTRTVGPAGPVIAFRLLRVSEDKKVIVDAEGTYPTQREIPVAEVPTAGRVSLFESEPPLLDLGYLNIAHYQQASDAAQSRHMTCVPFLFTAGFEMANEYGQPMTVGTNSGLNTTNADGKAMYVSHDGAALAECRAALTELRNDIGALGLAMLAPDQRAAETATAKRLDRAAESSALAVTARGVQDAVERALGFHARYLRLEDGGSVTINRDYDAELMDAQTMQAYGALATALGLPTVEVLKMLQRGGRLADDLDLEALALEMDAAKLGAEDAAAVQARLDAEDAMDAADPARQGAAEPEDEDAEDAD